MADVASAFLRRGCASVLEERPEILGCHKGLQMFSGKHWKKAGKTSMFESLSQDVSTGFCCYKMFQVQLTLIQRQSQACRGG